MLGLALAAFLRRQSRPSLRIALAVGALPARSVVPGLSVLDLLPGTRHHLLEHTLGVAMAALVIGAVSSARTVDQRTDRVEQ